MHRFFIKPELWDGTKIRLVGDQAHQIGRVLRMSPGEHIIVLDNSGWEFVLELEDVNEKAVLGRLVEKRLSSQESSVRVTLYQSLLKRENFEWVLQKCTEIGVHSFVPLLCERTIRQDRSGKVERWGKIVQEASEQSGRGYLPEISTPLQLKEALQQAGSYNCCWIAWEEEKVLSLGMAAAEIIRKPAPWKAALFIGPEGGFSAQEIEYARGKGVQPVSLGKRILRSETAAVASAAILLHLLEDTKIKESKKP